jgi:uncharacterized cupin superfamily protein
VNSARNRWQAGAPRAKPAARLRARIPWHDYLRDASMSTSIVRLDGDVETDVSEPAADRLIAGSPRTEVRNFFADGTQQFFAGRWSATRGKWRIRYTENELCVMTAGRVVLESASGQRCAFGPGDAFVVPAGFVGTWEVIEDCAKIYAIFESKD